MKNRDEKPSMPKNFLRDKYLDDFEKRQVLNPATGKMKTEYAYIGPHYELEKPELLTRGKVVLSLAALAIIAAWIISLSINGELAHSWVIVPDAFLALNLFYQICAVARTLTITAKKDLRREDKDKTAPRFKATGIAGVIIGFAGIICHIIYGAINGEVFGDLWNYAVNIVIIAGALITWKFSGTLNMKEKDKNGF